MKKIAVQCEIGNHRKCRSVSGTQFLFCGFLFRIGLLDVALGLVASRPGPGVERLDAQREEVETEALAAARRGEVREERLALDVAEHLVLN